MLNLQHYAKFTLPIYRNRRYHCPTSGKCFFEENPFLPRYVYTPFGPFLNCFKNFILSFHRILSSKFTTLLMHIRRVLEAVVPSLPELPEVLCIDEFRRNTNRMKYHWIFIYLSTSSPIDIFNNRIEAPLSTIFENINTPDN